MYVFIHTFSGSFINITIINSKRESLFGWAGFVAQNAKNCSHEMIDGRLFVLSVAWQSILIANLSVLDGKIYGFGEFHNVDPHVK